MSIELLKKINTKEIEFNGGTLEVKELTINQIQDFSENMKHVEDLESFEESRAILGKIIRAGVVGMEALTDEELGEVTIASIKKLSDEVLSFNGIKASDAEAESPNA